MTIHNNSINIFNKDINGVFKSYKIEIMESLSKTSNALASLSINDKLIADIDEVEPRVFISNDKTANKLSILKAFSITHVLIVANGIEIKFPKNFWYKVF